MAQQRRIEIDPWGERIEEKTWGNCSVQKKLEKEITGEEL
jgi:hypothetical protein